MEFLSYDLISGKHESAEKEWCPHKSLGPNAFEWHYFTAPLKGDNGHLYFLFFCDFNFNSELYRKAAMSSGDLHGSIPKDRIPIVNTVHLSDYDSGLYLNGHDTVLCKPGKLFDTEKNMLLIHDEERADSYDIRFSYKGDSVSLYAKTDIYECKLSCRGASRVMWMQDTIGKEGLIREGGKTERSFYYSLPQLPFTGWIKYRDKDGKEQKVDVTGDGWIDRQWGNFMTMSWEWTSFRFNDGDRLNTYNFGNGYQVCTLQMANGKTESYPKFTVVQNGYLRTPAKTWVSWGWDYYLPLKDGYYKLVPYSDKNIILSKMNTFFEGLSTIYDKEGKVIGCAVTESMDVKLMHNGPYDKFNNFPD
jgi:hypothetical protein